MCRQSGLSARRVRIVFAKSAPQYDRHSHSLLQRPDAATATVPEAKAPLQGQQRAVTDEGMRTIGCFEMHFAICLADNLRER